jgi:hypothetical protein
MQYWTEFDSAMTELGQLTPVSGGFLDRERFAIFLQGIKLGKRVKENILSPPNQQSNGRIET